LYCLIIIESVCWPGARRSKLRALSRRRWGRRLRRLFTVLVVSMVLTLIGGAGAVLAWRWIDPATTSFILQRKFSELIAGGDARDVEQRWVDWDGISEYAGIAVIASEDQRFSEHWGFDLDSIQEAIEERNSGGRVRGASTISQQVAKNLFLWPGRSWLRKGLEVYFTVLIEMFWSKQRILEVYLNIAQFGDRTFGVGAASQRFFGKQAAALSAPEAALLAAVLPNPVRMRADDPSPYVRERARWIQRQMRALGGPGSLRDILEERT
jgi:monofunctional biosynthetic peptidoglycan transglycosylase